MADKKFGERNIIIDGHTANRAENMLYRGNGMVSGNNTSRLLIDYKHENPEAYQELLNLLFGSEGLAISHLKVEMGSDVNSSSGTEPAIMRFEDEEPDPTRGAAYMLAADAKKVNPELTLDMLWWSEPIWVTKAEDVYAARYKWYLATLDSAYDCYGIKFDYLSAVRNERAYDSEWIKYLSKRLKSENSPRYDYSKVKIVAGDEVCTWNIAGQMLVDSELRDAIDVVGSHYTSFSTDEAKRLANEFGKELWFSESCSPMEYAQGTYRFEKNSTGLEQVNGLIDIAARFITMYSSGKMTLCEYQPAVAAYYEGVTYGQKQLITANEPWSGYYMLDGGFFMGLHFSQFIKKGWTFINSGCFADGQVGGPDSHAVVGTRYCYFTAADPSGEDFTTVIVNPTEESIVYKISAKNLKKAGAPLNVWQTRGPEKGGYDENYFKNEGVIDGVSAEGGCFEYELAVPPLSVTTLSTLDVPQRPYFETFHSSVLPLPFEGLTSFTEEELAARGFAPKYTTDQGGAFEIVNEGGENVIMQKITPDLRAEEWGYTPEPMTSFGDDRWFNYTISAKVRLDGQAGSYGGVGLRYSLAAIGASGYCLLIFTDGHFELRQGGKDKPLANGSADISPNGWNELQLTAVDCAVKAYINGKLCASFTANVACAAGRAALYSSFSKSCFKDVSLKPLSDDYFITRYDETDGLCTYSGPWQHNLMNGFCYYKRTSAEGSEGAELSISFNGQSLGLMGKTAPCTLKITIDDAVYNEAFNVAEAGFRELTVFINGLESGPHTVKVTVIKGSYTVDAVEIG